MPIGTNFQLTRMFPELKESEDERIRKAIVKMISDIDGGSPFEKYGIIKKEALAWLEKQAEQNSAIFIPKFKVGDWITFTRKDGTREVLQVSDIIDDRYHFNHLLQISWSIKECDEKCHLWTIQDAKDGDVLATGDEIFIHNGKLDLIGRVCAYCGIYKTYNELRFNCAANNYFTYIKPHPATKEQRDTLMKVMTDAGYTFDFEKKELKKIEQKPQRIVSAEAKEAMYDKLVEWSEEDKEIVEALGDYVKNLDILFSEIKIGDKNILSKEFREKVQSWLKCLKERVQPQPKQKWNEEDERNASYICAALDCYYRLREDRNNTNGQEDLDKARNWLYNKLKSLRPQNSSVTDEELAQAKKDAYNDALNKIEYHSGEPTFDDGWSAAIWYLKKRNLQPR